MRGSCASVGLPTPNFPWDYDSTDAGLELNRRGNAQNVSETSELPQKRPPLLLILHNVLQPAPLRFGQWQLVWRCKRHPSRFFGFIVNFQLAGFDLGGIYECAFLPDFAVAVRDQNVGIGVCAY